MRRTLLLIFALTGIVTVAQAQSGGAAGVIRERQANYKQIAGAVRTIGQQLRADQPAIGQIRRSAALIAERASQVHRWFPRGSGPEAGVPTRALPAIWANPRDFAAKANSFTSAARALDAAARRGDLPSVRAAMQTLGRTCGACHDSYRAPEDR